MLRNKLVLVTSMFIGASYANDTSLLLRYFFVPDIDHRVTVSSQSLINLGGVDLSERRGQVMSMSSPGNGDSGNLLLFEVSRQTSQLNGPGVDVSFDSSNLDTVTTGERFVELSETIGETFSRSVDDRGQTLSVEVGSVPDSAVEMSSLAMPVFPEDRVAIGESWEVVSSLKLDPENELSLSRQYTLESVTDGSAIVTYVVTIASYVSGVDLSDVSEPAENVVDELSFQITGGGRFQFDLQQGWLVSLSESTVVEGTMNGLPLTISTEWDVVVE